MQLYFVFQFSVSFKQVLENVISLDISYTIFMKYSICFQMVGIHSFSALHF